MLDSGWRQADLAAALNINHSYVSLILSGKRIPSLEVVQNMAAVTGIPIETLADEIGKPPARKRPVRVNGAKRGQR